MRKWKNGDRLLVEAKYVTYRKENDTDTVPHKLLVDSYTTWVSDECMEKAKLIEPEYEDGEYYWVKREKDDKWHSGLHVKKQLCKFFYVCGACYPVDSLLVIGEKIHRPEENENE